MNVSAHLLIVGGEPVARQVYQESLEAAGYQLSTAKTGEEALLWLHGSTPELVLLDLAPSEVEGLGVLEAMRDSGFAIPVVILTDAGQLTDVVAAMKLGAVDVLTKPFPVARLKAVVVDTLTRCNGSGPELGKPTTVTIQSEFVRNLSRARHAFRRCAFDEAEIFLRQALALDVRSAEAHNLLGAAFELRKQVKAAYRQYREARRADRGFAPARNNLRRLRRQAFFGRDAEPVDTGELKVMETLGTYVSRAKN